MIITFNDAARQDFNAAASWYADIAGAARASNFRNEVQRSLKLLSEHPTMGSPSAATTRSLVVHRHPYSVIYRVDGKHLRVLAIAHQHRRPVYWSGRR